MGNDEWWYVESERYMRRKACRRSRILVAAESRLGTNGGTTASHARVPRAVRWWHDGRWHDGRRDDGLRNDGRWYVESECHVRRKACRRTCDLAAAESRLGTNGGTAAGHARVPNAVWNDVG